MKSGIYPRPEPGIPPFPISEAMSVNHPGQVYGLAGSADSVKAAADVSDVMLLQKASLKKMFGSPVEGAKVAIRPANVPMTKNGDALDWRLCAFAGSAGESYLRGLQGLTVACPARDEIQAARLPYGAIGEPVHGYAIHLDVPLGTAAHEVAAVHAEYAALHERELPDAPPHGDAQQHDRHVLERAAHTSCEYAHAVAGLCPTRMAVL